MKYVTIITSYSFQNLVLLLLLFILSVDKIFNRFLKKKRIIIDVIVIGYCSMAPTALIFRNIM